MKPQWKAGDAGKWEGGRIKVVAGRDVYVIERRIGTLRRSVRLEAAGIDEARAELVLFNRDPEGYRTGRKAKPRGTAVCLDPAPGGTYDQFKAFCQARVDRDDLVQRYVDGLMPYLGAWMRALNGADLRKVDLGTLQRHLKKTWKGVATHKRVVALKAFTAWMREEGTEAGLKLHRNEDPTIDLKTPEIVPAQAINPKGYPIKMVERFYRELPSQLARDIVLLRAKLGLHDTEIARIALGKARLRRVTDPSGIEGVVVFQHLKKGKPHALSIDAQTFAAAERMQARGKSVGGPILGRMLDRAAVRIHGCGGVTKKLERTRVRKDNGRVENIYETKPCKECTRLLPGELRHSFATWATTEGEEVYPRNQRGIDVSKVSERMGHLSARTTAAFYIGDRVPMMIRLPLRLEHPNDPVPMKRAPAERAGG